jgi:hypothetical protein
MCIAYPKQSFDRKTAIQRSQAIDPWKNKAVSHHLNKSLIHVVGRNAFSMQTQQIENLADAGGKGMFRHEFPNSSRDSLLLLGL